MQRCNKINFNLVHRLANGIVTALLLACLGCASEAPKPDVSHIDIDVQFTRFDSLLFTLDSNRNADTYSKIKTDHPAFTELYVHRIFGLPKSKDSLTQSRLTRIAQAPQIQALRDSIHLHYSDLGEIKEEFRSAFQFYRYYFPEFSVPDVYFCFTEFAIGTFLFETADGGDGLGLSLDMFLGSTFPYELLAQNETTFSQYLVRTFNADHMVRKALEILIEDKLTKTKDERLIDYMVDRGRTLYIIKKVVPSMPDSILFEYSSAQTEWCRESELAMWAHILDKELLYERKMKKINTMVSPAPTTMGMPPESPGRTADFLGYQIIDQYVQNTDCSLRDLLSLKDAQNVLKRSKYKGRNLNL